MFSRAYGGFADEEDDGDFAKADWGHSSSEEDSFDEDFLDEQTSDDESDSPNETQKANKTKTLTKKHKPSKKVGFLLHSIFSSLLIVLSLSL